MSSSIPVVRTQLKNMLAGIRAQVALIQTTTKPIFQQIKLNLKTQRMPEKIFLIGCGDSLYSAIATRLAYQSWTQTQVEPIQALEFSRYDYRFVPDNSLVLGISNSGYVARTLEAVKRARISGIPTLALTGNPESPLALAADQAFLLQHSERSPGPGTSSYIASLLFHFGLALALAERFGRLSSSEIGHILNEIESQAVGMQKTIDNNEQLIEEMCRHMQADNRLVFMGAGPNHGTALFGMAKIIEAASIHAIGQELEEWAHEHFFGTDSSTWSIVLASPGASTDRAREQLWAINEMRSQSVVICDEQDNETARLAKYAIRVYGGKNELISPLNYAVPPELIAVYHASATQGEVIGTDDPHVREVNLRQIFQSQLNV